MECRESQEELSAYLDGELSLEQRTRVEEHLSGCETCRAELQALRDTVALVGGLPRAKAPESLADAVARRIREPASAAQRISWGRMLWPAAAAACVAVLLYVHQPGDAPRPMSTHPTGREPEAKPYVARSKPAAPRVGQAADVAKARQAPAPQALAFRAAPKPAPSVERAKSRGEALHRTVSEPVAVADSAGEGAAPAESRRLGAAPAREMDMRGQAMLAARARTSAGRAASSAPEGAAALARKRPERRIQFTVKDPAAARRDLEKLFARLAIQRVPPSKGKGSAPADRMQVLCSSRQYALLLREARKLGYRVERPPSAKTLRRVTQPSAFKATQFGRMRSVAQAPEPPKPPADKLDGEAEGVSARAPARSKLALARKAETRQPLMVVTIILRQIPPPR